MSKYGNIFSQIPAHFSPFERSCARQALMQHSRMARAARAVESMRRTFMDPRAGQRGAVYMLKGKTPSWKLAHRMSFKMQKNLTRYQNKLIGRASVPPRAQKPGSTQRKAECHARAYAAKLHAEREQLMQSLTVVRNDS